MTLSHPVGGPLIECHRSLSLDSALFQIFINGLKIDIRGMFIRFSNDIKL